MTVVGPDGGLKVPTWMLAATAARFCVSAYATLAEVQQDLVALMADAIRAVLGRHGEGHDDQADAAR